MKTTTLIFKNSAISTLLVTALLLISACGSSEKKDRPKAEYYGSSSSSAGLEVPPDLTQTDPSKNIKIPGATGSDDDQNTGVLSNSNVLAEPSNVKMLRDGQQRWLVVDDVPANVWPQLVSFWERDGVKLSNANPRSGVIETDWLINYADLTSGVEKLFRGLINKLTSSGQRDKYRVRIDNGEIPNTTEVFVTHQGLEEVSISPNTKTVGDFKWVKRPADTGLEIEVMRQMMVYLGVEEEQAKNIVDQNKPERSERARLLVEDIDEPVVILDEAFPRAWQRVGLALDRLGYTIYGRNREQGGYVIELADSAAIEDKKPGFFGRLFQGKLPEAEDVTFRMQVRLIPQTEEKTAVAVATEEGLHDNSPTAISLLTQLHEQLK